MIRVTLPYHLQNLAGLLSSGETELLLAVDGPITLGAVLDSIERAYPVLRGTMRDHNTHKRRPFIRFFASGTDMSHEPVDTPLPSNVADGTEPFMVVGAIAGG